MLLLNWDEMHQLAKQELCENAAVNKDIALMLWDDIYSGIQECLDYSLTKRSKGHVGLDKVMSRTGNNLSD